MDSKADEVFSTPTTVVEDVDASKKQPTFEFIKVEANFDGEEEGESHEEEIIDKNPFMFENGEGSLKTEDPLDIWIKEELVEDEVEDQSSDSEEDINFDDSDNDEEDVQEDNNESSDSEDDENVDDPAQPLAGPSRTAREDGWTVTDEVPNIDFFCGDSGVTDVPQLDVDSSLIEFFEYFIDNELLRHFKQQTNLYAQQKLRKLGATNSLSHGSRMNNWKTITVVDIRKFLAIIFHMCISKRPQVSDHWSQNPVVSCNFCPNVMSRDKFLLLMANFHLNDNSTTVPKGQRGHDPLHKVRPLLDNLQFKYQRAYLPGENVTIDEGMCKFRGRLQFKVHMPKKPSKYGIKLLMLSESSSGYIWNFSVYCGQSNTVVDETKRLLGSLVGCGRTLFTDRFYTSPLLAKELESLKTGLVGTTRKNRCGLPLALKQTKLKRGEQIFRRKGNILALKWKNKRNVFMISTRHTSEMITYHNRVGREKTKPACVVSYNKNKFGVDLLDQRMSYGAYDHKSIKWWRKMAFHMFLMSLVNACILFNKVKNKKISAPQFIRTLCSDLAVSEDEPLRPSTSGSQLSRLATGKHFLEKLPIPPGKKRCQRMCKVCSEKGTKETGKAKRKDTSYRCCECKVSLCKDPCFKLYHSKKNYKV